VTIDESISGVELASGKIPGRTATGEVDGQASVRATGQRESPSAAARGYVTFTNRSARPVNVPASTILLAGSVSFATTQALQIGPAIKAGDVLLPATGVAAVQAVQPGESGNLPPGAVTAIGGPLGSQLSVLNSTSMTSGAKATVSYLSSDDQAKARDALRGQLVSQALDKIHSQLNSNDSFLPNPASLGDGAIEDVSYDQSPEQVTSQTQLHMRVLVKGLVFQGGDVNQVVAQSVTQALAKEGAGARLEGGSPLTVSPPELVSNDGSTAQIRVHASGKALVPVDLSAAANRVRGLDPIQARAALRGLPGVADGDVQLWPAWASKVPSFAWRIHTTAISPAD